MLIYKLKYIDITLGFWQKEIKVINYDVGQSTQLKHPFISGIFYEFFYGLLNESGCRCMVNKLN